MKIGIKYCGGCNPTYDRTAVVANLKQHIGIDDSIETANQGIIYDLIVILCGCTSACASHQNLETRCQKIYVTSKSDSIKLINIIDKIKVSLLGEW